jgi:hypothetical protein
MAPLVGGLRTLWRGAEATTFRGVVLTISQIASYDHIKQVFKSRRWMDEGVPLHTTASFLAGYLFLFPGLIMPLTTS